MSIHPLDLTFSQANHEALYQASRSRKPDVLDKAAFVLFGCGLFSVFWGLKQQAAPFLAYLPTLGAVISAWGLLVLLHLRPQWYMRHRSVLIAIFKVYRSAEVSFVTSRYFPFPSTTKGFITKAIAASPVTALLVNSLGLVHAFQWHVLLQAASLVISLTSIPVMCATHFSSQQASRLISHIYSRLQTSVMQMESALLMMPLVGPSSDASPGSACWPVWALLLVLFGFLLPITITYWAELQRRKHFAALIGQQPATLLWQGLNINEQRLAVLLACSLLVPLLYTYWHASLLPEIFVFEW